LGFRFRIRFNDRVRVRVKVFFFIKRPLEWVKGLATPPGLIIYRNKVLQEGGH